MPDSCGKGFCQVQGVLGLSARREGKLGFAFVLLCVLESGMDTEVVYGNFAKAYSCMLLLLWWCAQLVFRAKRC